MGSSQSMSEFYVTLTGDLLSRLLIPAEISRRHKNMMCGEYHLQNAARNSWTVMIRKRKTEHYFMEGWPEFVEGNRFEEGDHLVFCYVGKSTFRVDIFAKTGCEKGSSSSNGDHGVPSNVTPVSSETPLGGEPSTPPGSEFVPPNGYLCRQLPGELTYPIDVDDPPDFTAIRPRRQLKRERGISPTMGESSTSKAPLNQTAKKGKPIGGEKSLSDDDTKAENRVPSKKEDVVIISSSSSGTPFQHTHTASHSDDGQSVAEPFESDRQDTDESSFQAYIDQLCKAKLVSDDTFSSPSEPHDSSDANVEIEEGTDPRKSVSAQEYEDAAEFLPDCPPTEPVVADSPNEEEIPQDVPQNVPTHPPDTVSVPAAFLLQQVRDAEYRIQESRRATSHWMRYKEELLALLGRQPSGTEKADESGEDGIY